MLMKNLFIDFSDFITGKSIFMNMYLNALVSESFT